MNGWGETGKGASTKKAVAYNKKRMKKNALPQTAALNRA
jgi:hypothetical protein